MACSFRHKAEFAPSISSIQIIDKRQGAGFLVLLLEETGRDGIACDGCKDLAVPICMQYCRESEDLRKILEGFTGRDRPDRESKAAAVGPADRGV